ncbi:MAG: hypothetical protein ACXAE3_00690 [Candidatus Kariarchaeaceae archaeon]|jgi:DNA-binding transcriptional ArsR family regulator
MSEEMDREFKVTANKLQEQWNMLRDRYASLEADQLAEVNRLQAEKDELQQKYDEAKSKIDKIEGQLANTLSQMDSLSKTTDKGIDAMQLLDLYLVLMDNVYESSMHTRLLIILHGAKESYTYNELTTAAGMSGVQVRQALFELRNAGIVDYDEETQVAKLVTKFM